MSDTWSEAVQAHREGNFQRAEHLYNEVLLLAKEEENVDDQAVILESLARLALDCDNDHVALRRFRKLLKMQEAKGDNIELSKIYRHIAGIYDRRDSTVEAIQYAEKALEVAEAVWSKQQRASSCHLLGILYQRATMENKSVSILRQAQSIWEELNDEFGLFHSTMVLADILEFQGQVQLCIRELRKCLKILKEEKNIEECAKVYSRIAYLHFEQGDYQRALGSFLASFGISGSQEDAEMIQKIRISLGEDEFWSVVSSRLMRREGVSVLRRKLEEFFPPSPPEEVEAPSEVVATEEPEVDTTPDEVVSDEASQTQELAEKTVARDIVEKPAVVSVTYDDSEDVDRTEDSVFVDNFSSPSPSLELTNRLEYIQDDIKRSFVLHFLAALVGVFLALFIAKVALLILFP